MTASEQIDNEIKQYDDWRGAMLAKLRRIINEAYPDLTEEWKWNTPVWTRNGLVCAISAFKNHVKINFFRGAELEDPDGLFNAGLDAKTMRSIDFFEGDSIDESALQNLIRTAVNYNNAEKK